ncbi:MAG TPA: 2-dehydro-3-deoxygalactonokinase [Steroidobacteraceae bacterium]
MDCALIGVDWGTTRLRAFRIGVDGRILERRASDRGVVEIRDGDFDRALRDVMGGWPSDIPILMCGMIGSRQGWTEVPYRPCPACVSDLADTLCPIETSCGPAWIVGGVCAMNAPNGAAERGARKLYDVMRGEETQMLGVAPDAGRTVMITPGTHSKWAVVQAGSIESFRTHMTGEIYAVLQKHSILGSLMPEGNAGQFDEASFLDGVHLGLEEVALSHALFSVRTQGLFAQKSPPELVHYLSGILIGSEVSAEARSHAMDSTVVVIASAELAGRYQIALSACGFCDVRHVDAEGAVAQGLWKLWQLRARAP